MTKHFKISYGQSVNLAIGKYGKNNKALFLLKLIIKMEKILLTQFLNSVQFSDCNNGPHESSIRRII